MSGSRAHLPRVVASRADEEASVNQDVLEAQPQPPLCQALLWGLHSLSFLKQY